MSREKFIQYVFYAALAYGVYYAWKNYSNQVQAVSVNQDENLTLTDAEMAQVVSSFKPY